LIIEKINIKKINPAKYNPRKDLKPGDSEYDKLKKSIAEFDLVEPLIWNKRTGNLVGGHQRLKILQEMGLKTVDVSVVDLDEAKEKALNLALNKIQGDWDLPKLKDLLQELDTGELDMEITGFDSKEIEELMTQFHVAKEGLTNDDEIPDKVETICKLGDLWQLGNHRLLCGDATKKEDVERLMNGEKADMVFTDPPYGANISGMMQDVHGQSSVINRTRRWEQIKGDENEDADLEAFLESAFRNIADNSKDDAAWYIWHAMLTQGFFAAAAATAANLLLHRQIIWVKPALILAFGHYHWRHELCFYGWKRGHEPKFYGGTNANTVWEMDYDGKGRMPKDERKHPTQKPVSLGMRAIENSSLLKQNVIDLFGGSGSTLIACEKLDRRCFMMEIEPHYCDVIIQRWENFTGQEAMKL